MNVAQSREAERDPRQIGGARHLQSRIQIRAVRDKLPDVLSHQFDRIQVDGVRHGACVQSDVRLKGMHEGVHA